MSKKISYVSSFKTYVLDEAELSPAQKEYQEYFNKALKKFDVESPADLSKEKKSEFFDTLKGWKPGTKLKD